MITAIALLLLIIAILSLILFLAFRYFRKRIHSLEAKYGQKLELERNRHEIGLASQRGSIAGVILEKFLPFFAEYPYDLEDVVAVFDTFDLLVLRGRSNKGGKVIEEIVFQEIKTGDPYLSPIQESLRGCVGARRVRFETWHRNKKTGKFYLIEEQD